jgi:Raf kinase inhibitor-like YbhB/YbcL family protein
VSGRGGSAKLGVAGPLAASVVAALAVAGCGGGEKPSKPLPSAAPSMTLSSPAFENGGAIPKRFTCEGKDVSPPLRFSNVPFEARELDLLVEDPDADRFVHWTLLRIPPTIHYIAEGEPPSGTAEAENGFGNRSWGGPCPPEGQGAHRYVFGLYATDAPLGLTASASADDVRSAIAKHAIATGRLTARFSR